MGIWVHGMTGTHAMLQMTNAASESAKSEIARRLAQEAKAAEVAAAKAALVRDFPSLQPTTPSPAPPQRELLSMFLVSCLSGGVKQASFCQAELAPTLLDSSAGRILPACPLCLTRV